MKVSESLTFSSIPSVFSRLSSCAMCLLYNPELPDSDRLLAEWAKLVASSDGTVACYHSKNTNLKHNGVCVLVSGKKIRTIRTRYAAEVANIFVKLQAVCRTPSKSTTHTDDWKAVQQSLASQNKALVLFFAPWCGHCRAFMPEWETITKRLSKHDGVTTHKIDCDAHGDVAAQNECEKIIATYNFIFKTELNSVLSKRNYESWRKAFRDACAQTLKSYEKLSLNSQTQTTQTTHLPSKTGTTPPPITECR